MHAMRGLLPLLVLACMAVEAAAADLAMSINGRQQTFTADALLAHPAAVTLTIPQDVSYKRAMTYRAVPASVILAGLARDDTVRFVAADGFSASIPAAPLLATGDDQPRAYLAIEPQAAAWPPLKAGQKATAGPFYLVWMNPEKGRIAAEQWPYQVARIETVPPVATRFPALLPAPSVANSDPIRHGFVVYSNQCLPCHTLNLAGDSHVGPDLNVPFSPTEYMREDFLRQQVRNPQSVRIWAESRMPRFDVNVLSERDLDDLVSYLNHMARRKVELPKG